MKRNQWLWTILTAATAVAIVAALVLKNDATAPATIRVGGAFPLSGDATTVSWGIAARNGAELAVEELNARGGINGTPVELISEDMQSSSKGSISAVTKLITLDHVQALLVSWLDVYQGAIPVATAHTVPIISPDGGIEAINSPTVHADVFSTWYRTDVKARKVIQYMASHGIHALGIFVQNDSYYNDFVARIRKYAAQNNMQIVIEENIDESAGDIRTQTLRVGGVKPDAIFFALYDDKQLHGFLDLHARLFPAIPLYGDELVQDHYQLPEYKGLYEGATFFRATAPDSGFSERYHARFGSAPAFGAGPAYDAVMIYAAAVADKGLSANLDTYLRDHDFETVSYGTMTFDAIGGVQTANNQFDLLKIEGGKAVRVE